MRREQERMKNRGLWLALMAVLVALGSATLANLARAEERERPELLYGTPTNVAYVKAGYVTGPIAGGCTLWVGWYVDADKLANPLPRKGFPFHGDDLVPDEFRVLPTDYVHSGDDRGHISPYADNAFSEESAVDSMSMLNMMPQRKKLNEGHTKWEGLENWHRVQVRENGAVNYRSFAGPAFLPNEDGIVTFRVIGKHHSWEPTHCWRTSVIEYPRHRIVLKSWLMPNVDEPPDFTECQISCDDLERKVSLNFWPTLNGADELEARDPEGQEENGE